MSTRIVATRGDWELGVDAANLLSGSALSGLANFRRYGRQVTGMDTVVLRRIGVLNESGDDEGGEGVASEIMSRAIGSNQSRLGWNMRQVLKCATSRSMGCAVRIWRRRFLSPLLSSPPLGVLLQVDIYLWRAHWPNAAADAHQVPSLEEIFQIQILHWCRYSSSVSASETVSSLSHSNGGWQGMSGGGAPLREPRNRPVSPRRSGPLLQRHRYFQGVRDFGQARDLVAGMCGSHEMDLAGRPPLHAWMNVVTGRKVRYSTIGYGAASVVKPGRTESFFPVMIPLTGGGAVQAGHQRVAMSTTMAAVVSASEPLSMRLTRACTLVVVSIDRDALESQVGEMIGEPISRPLRFSLGMDLTEERAARCYRQLRSDLDDLDSPDSLILSHDLAAYYAEQRLMTSLLLTQPHNYSEHMRAGRIIRTPTRIVRVAKDLIEEHPELPHTRTSLAKQTCCSVRALDAAFKKHIGQTPMAYLRERRFQRARELLSCARADVATVTKIASDCGFTHLGRFAAEYQQRFGESPSTTLRRC